MKADILYETAGGRFLFRCMQKTGFFHLASWFLHTKVSKLLIPGYIRKNDIDMSRFEGQSYDCFADFFSRKLNKTEIQSGSGSLISPCDGLLSVYTISEDLKIPMKGSVYTADDLIPDQKLAQFFQSGLCLVFRLEASDYHHFCCFDDGLLLDGGFIPGELHSVQPAALSRFHVYRLNRRWWSLLQTAHFRKAVQIEVGAMAVGGVSFSIGYEIFRRGQEMGCFELAGSTIILMFEPSVRARLVFSDNIVSEIEKNEEVRVRMGSEIARLKDENTDENGNNASSGVSKNLHPYEQ